VKSKKELRKQYLAALQGFAFLDLVLKSSDLRTRYFDFVENHRALLQGKIAVSFHPFEGEPQINIEREERDEPYRVGYVRIENWESREMSARFARRDTPDLWEEFVLKNGSRIYQPKTTERMCEEQETALILVPGAAFTSKGARLGRGAGFYDRFLKRFPHALRMGIAFQEQLALELPLDSWDERVDIVLTDRGLFQTKSYGEWRIHGKVLNRDP
jgi:5,10-methenyltetrahydrofolate synthetase